MRRGVALAAAGLILAMSVAPAGASASDGTADAAPGGTWVNSTVTIVTNFGTIVAMLYDEGAPITVNNFLNLTTSEFYNGIKFHRIVDDFVIQTGDPNTKDNNPYNDGTGGSGTTIPLEINENLTHIDGALGMARSSDPNSASSQFYICDGPQHQLDGSYAVFGVVIEGIDVVRQIAAQPVWGMKRPLISQQPIDDIVMESVTASFGYEQPASAGSGGGGGGFLGDLASFAGGESEVGASVLAIVVVALLGTFSVASLRRRAWGVVGSYGSEVRHMRLRGRGRRVASGRMAGRRSLAGARGLTKGVARGLRSGVRRSTRFARTAVLRRR